jgi:hypothetical protein
VREIEGQLACNDPTEFRVVVEAAVLLLLDRCGGIVELRLVGAPLHRDVHRLDLFLVKARPGGNENQSPDPLRVLGRTEQCNEAAVRVAE